MDESTTVWLVRHGLPDGSSGLCYGRHDIPLSLEGMNRARQIARQLRGEPISHIYSSSLRRAVDTARILAEPHGLIVQTMEELREIDFGDLDGLTYDEIQRQRPDVFQSWMARPTDVQFPNGESFRQMTARVLGAFDKLVSRHHNQSIAVVAHAGVIRIAISKALSIPDSEIFRLAQRYGAINRIKYSEHGPILELMNG